MVPHALEQRETAGGAAISGFRTVRIIGVDGCAVGGRTEHREVLVVFFTVGLRIARREGEIEHLAGRDVAAGVEGEVLVAVFLRAARRL